MMLTDFLRDHAFAIALFGVMTMVWLGWGQEDPPASWRWRLGLGSGLGVLLAVPFVIAVVTHWRTPSALDEGYGAFIIVVAIEFVVAAVGCVVLAVRRASRWMSWWVALVVAVHFIPLTWIFGDASYAILGGAQAIAVVAVLPRLRRSRHPASRLVGPLMGGTFLVFALASAIVFVGQRGLPWAS